MGEKAQKVLAWHLKAEEASQAFNSIETENGNVTGNPKEMTNDCYYYGSYYSLLHTMDSPEDLSMIDSFFNEHRPTKINRGGTGEDKLPPHKKKSKKKSPL